MTHAPRIRSDEELLGANLAFYDPLWAQSRLSSPERFNTWPLVRSLLTLPQSRLEVGPGLRPRLPLGGTCFVDASLPAVAKLRERGASAELGLVSRLPFRDGAFDLVQVLAEDESTDRNERSGVEEQLDALVRCQLTALVLPPNSLLARRTEC